MIIPAESLALENYSVTDLLRLRDRITTLLPPAELEALNLGQELVSVFTSAKALLSEADDDVALSQKAATVNSIISSLKVLRDMQTELYDIHNQQRLEQALIETLKLFPDMHDRFFEIYENELK